MDAMLVAMEKLGIKNPQAHFDKVSQNNLDLGDEEAMNFVSLIDNAWTSAGVKQKIFQLWYWQATPTWWS